MTPGTGAYLARSPRSVRPRLTEHSPPAASGKGPGWWRTPISSSCVYSLVAGSYEVPAFLQEVLLGTPLVGNCPAGASRQHHVKPAVQRPIVWGPGMTGGQLGRGGCAARPRLLRRSPPPLGPAPRDDAMGLAVGQVEQWQTEHVLLQEAGLQRLDPQAPSSRRRRARAGSLKSPASRRRW